MNQRNRYRGPQIGKRAGWYQPLLTLQREIEATGDVQRSRRLIEGVTRCENSAAAMRYIEGERVKWEKERGSTR